MTPSLRVPAALIVLAALSCAASAVDRDALCRRWVQSYEEQRPDAPEQIFRPAGSRTFPPSRFRMEYEFARDGTCQWLFLSPDDAHRFKPGTWSIDPREGGVLRITADGATTSYRIAALTGDVLRLTPIEAAPDPQSPLQLGLDQPAEYDGLVLTWIALEDSRCPEGVMCAWAGEARVRIRVRDGADDREIALTLGAGEGGDAVRTSRHEIRLLAVDPYPRHGSDVAREHRRATVAVTRGPRPAG